MEKNRIGIYMEKAYPLMKPEIDEPFGGAEVDLYTLGTYFSRHKQYSVTSYVNDYGQRDKIEFIEGMTVEKIPFSKNSNSSSFLKKLVRNFGVIASLFKSKNEIYFSEALGDTIGWMAIICKLLKRKKIVFRLASDFDTNPENAKTYSYKTYLLFKIGLYMSDCIISQTKWQQKELKDKTGLNSMVIPNGLYLSDIKSTIQGQKNTILWVGRCVELKRPELFIELAKRLPKYKFVMILSSQSSYRDRIVSMGNGVNNLVIHSQIPYHKIQNFYNKAKIFVNTSIYEGFPNAFIQACAGAAPILTFNVNPDNFLTNYQLGFCCNDNMDKAVDFIINLMGKTEMEYRRNAFNYVSSKHNIDEIGREYDNLFDKILLKDGAI